MQRHIRAPNSSGIASATGFVWLREAKKSRMLSKPLPRSPEADKPPPKLLCVWMCTDLALRTTDLPLAQARQEIEDVVTNSVHSNNSEDETIDLRLPPSSSLVLDPLPSPPPVLPSLGSKACCSDYLRCSAGVEINQAFRRTLRAPSSTYIDSMHLGKVRAHHGPL